MPVKPGDIIRFIELSVVKLTPEGGTVEENEKVYYRPVTQAWLDKWAAQGLKERIAAERTAQLLIELAGAEGARADAQKRLDGAMNGHRAELQEAVTQAVGKVDEIKASLEGHRKENPEPEYDLLSRQMAEILTDVGYLGDDDRPLPVTPETLAKVVDREYLEEIRERIEKKLFRR